MTALRRSEGISAQAAGIRAQVGARSSDRPWLGQYDVGVPDTLAPYPDRTLVDVVREAAAERPNHPALLFKGRRVSYAELDATTAAFAAGLRAAGVRHGDRVALLIPNSPQAIVAQFGAWKAGAIVVPLNPLYTEHELEQAVTTVEASAIVTLTPFYRKIKAIQPRTAIRTVIATNIKESLPALARAAFTLLKERQQGHRVTLDEADRWLADVIAAGRAAPHFPTGPAPDDPALLLFTGGTTGEPKGALGTHRAILASAMQTHAWFRPVLREWDDVVLLAMPLFHVYGSIGILGTSLIGHHPVALVPNPRDLGDVIRTVERTKAAFFPAVPTLFNALLDHPRVNAGKADFSSVKLCISGSAPLLAESRRRFESLTGGRMVDAYSITESMNAAIIQPVAKPPRPGAIGVPVPDVDVRIVDADTGRAMPANAEGELLIRAPQLMAGYWGRPDESAAMIVDGWLHTGDIAVLDDDGYVHVVDRKKDMIKSGGHGVWPREVEEVLAAHPDVADAGVAGVENPRYGESVKAFVVARAGSALSADDLLTWTRERLAPYKVPREVEFRDVLPRSHIGKVLRRRLASEGTGARLATVQVNGAGLAVEERGGGADLETILFCHGVLLNKRIFERQMDALQDRYRCVAFDFRGHGRSQVTDDGYAVDELTADAAALIRELGLGPVHVVGHSLGAFVGLRLAARQPELVRSLVVVSASADRQPRLDVVRYRMLQAIARRVGLAPLAGSLMATLFGKAFREDPARAAERDAWRQDLATMSLRGALLAVDGVLGRAAVIDELPRIGAPTLVVVGEHDPAAPLRLGERIRAGIPGARLVTVPTGHTSPVERPELVTAAIEQHLSATKEAGR
jgi:long-chain acyl-CoA synthetase